MRFSQLINQAMFDKGLTGKALSQMSGINEASISEYRNGVTEPTPERRAVLCKLLEINEGGRMETDAITVKEASEILGISTRLVQLGMQQDRFRPQIGLAVKCDKHWSYTPFRSKVERWKNAQ